MANSLAITGLRNIPDRNDAALLNEIPHRSLMGRVAGVSKLVFSAAAGALVPAAVRFGIAAAMGSGFKMEALYDRALIMPGIAGLSALLSNDAKNAFAIGLSLGSAFEITNALGSVDHGSAWRATNNATQKAKEILFSQKENLAKAGMATANFARDAAVQNWNNCLSKTGQVF